MSHLGTTLKALMEQNGKTGAEISRISGLQQPLITRWARGDQTYISELHIERLANAITTDPNDKARLLRAHLLDECKGPGANLIDIKIKDAPEEIHETLVPRGLDADLVAIRKWAVEDDDIKKIVTALADVYRRRQQQIRERETDFKFAKSFKLKKEKPRP